MKGGEQGEGGEGGMDKIAESMFKQSIKFVATFSTC